MTIQLRLEQPEDYQEVEILTREAFWNIHEPGCCEHFLVHKLHSSDALVRELAFVATDGPKIVGNILYTKSAVVTQEGTRHEVLTFGPVSVLPEYQRKGVGSALIGHTKQIATDLGYRAIFIYGDPAYYSRVGFSPASDYAIQTADGMYAAALQVCVLSDEGLSGIRGRFVEDPIFEIKAEEAEAFDEGFPFKEKISGTPSQERFLEILRMTHKPVE
ncbi:MAG TPA: N-acetyltransferase [Thermotogota bacterium]|nr:N-acetyltransferase [Thermotogota bacterium]HRW35759.1 N-acetyltransferase [Thermotogota bacterium]